MSFLDNRLSTAQSYLLGPRCVLCRAAATPARELCDDCAQELPWLHRACTYCALPLPADGQATHCRVCAKRPRFDRAIAAFVYEQPIRWLIARLKFQGQLTHARLLGDLLGDRVAKASVARPDLLVPVPLHPAGYRRRGFNQAERLARRIARVIDRPVATRTLVRRRDTTRQSTLAANQRAANVRGAFACQRELSVAHVAIVDDVVTTGATAAAVAACLRQAGAARVDLYCVGRA